MRSGASRRGASPPPPPPRRVRRRPRGTSFSRPTPSWRRSAFWSRITRTTCSTAASSRRARRRDGTSTPSSSCPSCGCSGIWTASTAWSARRTGRVWKGPTSCCDRRSSRRRNSKRPSTPSRTTSTPPIPTGPTRTWGGGAVPKNEQSIAYLVRNDVLTNLENLQAEVTYLRKEKHTGGPLETEDLYSYSTLVKEGMVKYLELVPPGELRRGKEYLAESGSA